MRVPAAPSRTEHWSRSSLSLITSEDRGNCFSDNDYETSFSFIGELPPCPDEPGTGGAGGMGGEAGEGGAGGTGGTMTGGSSSGCNCTVGGPSPFRFSTTWLILCGAAALLLRRRLGGSSLERRKRGKKARSEDRAFR